MPTRPVLAARLTPGLLCLVAAVASSCAGIPEPEGYVAAPSTTIPDGDGAEVDAAPEPDFVPQAPVDYLVEVLMTAAGQVLFSGDGSSVEPVPSAAVAGYSVDAADDLIGGLVVERVIEDRQVVWLARGGEPEILDSGEVRLLDVAYQEGSPVALILSDARLVEGIRLADKVQTMEIELAENEEVLSFSAASGLNALAVGDEQCGQIRFYSSSGERADVAGPGEPDCLVPRRPGYGAVALDPDGTDLAYTVVTYRGDSIAQSTEVAIRDLDSGADYFSRVIGGLGEDIESLSFDGDRLAFLRVSVEGTEVVMIELADGTETTIDLGVGSSADSVSFARVPLAGEASGTS